MYLIDTLKFLKYDLTLKAINNKGTSVALISVTKMSLITFNNFTNHSSAFNHHN